jgi:hypothetical protein
MILSQAQTLERIASVRVIGSLMRHERILWLADLKTAHFGSTAPRVAYGISLKR